MNTATKITSARAMRMRLTGALLGAACLLGLLGAAQAAASPSWGIGIVHKNLYGVGGLVSPYTNSGEAFNRESSANAYSIQVVNKSLGAGTTLTCEEGTWSGAEGFEYQWVRNGAPIIGATSATYETDAADEGKALQCAVTGTNAGTGKTTAYTQPRQVGSVAAVGLPRLGGNQKIEASEEGNPGSVLTCDKEFAWRWADFSYQWLKNGTPIADATSKTYTIQAADTPATIQCAVTAINAAGTIVGTTPALQTEPAPSPSAPTFEVSAGPSIAGGKGADVAGGSPVGQQLPCIGSPASATLTYQWLRNGAPIAGATSSKYSPVEADSGTPIQCLVTASTSEGTSLAASAPRIVAPNPETNPPVPDVLVVSGIFTAGNTLTCTPGAWGGSPSFAFQWFKDGVALAGETASTYSIGVGDIGQGIQCRVIGTNAGGSVVRFSTVKVVAQILPMLDSFADRPTISGTRSIGNILTCNPGTWQNGPTFTYQWLRNGSSIADATASTYEVSAADEGTNLQCLVFVTNSATTFAARSANAVIAPEPGTAPPSGLDWVNFGAANGGAFVVGAQVGCSLNSSFWEVPATTIATEWLRNGVPIPGTQVAEATGFASYTLTPADLNKTIQCVARGSNAGGGNFETIDGTFPQYVNPNPPSASASLAVGGSTSVAIALPPGLELAGAGDPVINSLDDDGNFTPGPSRSSGAAFEHGQKIHAQGWNCNVLTLTCSRADELAPGAAFPPIILHVRVSPDAPDPATTSIAVSGGSASPLSTFASDPTQILPAVPFGIAYASAAVEDDAHNSYTQAGGHPQTAWTDIRTNVSPVSSGALSNAGGDPQEIWADLPPGFSANPQNFPQCLPKDLPGTIGPNDLPSNDCIPGSAIGFIRISIGNGTVPDGFTEYAPGLGNTTSLLYNLKPLQGLPAEFGFNVLGISYYLEAQLRSDGDYGLTVGTAKTPAQLTINSAEVTICANGVSTETDNTGVFPQQVPHCAAAPPNAVPFINNASKCAGDAPLTTVRMNSYQHPDEYAETGAYVGAPVAPFSFPGHPAKSTPVADSFVKGCQALTEVFKPTIKFQPDNTRADSPVGYDIDLHIPQSNRQDSLMAPALKKTVVTLPEGTSLNASAANGLGACTTAQIGLIGTGFPAPNPIHFDKTPIRCPDNSKVATLQVESPLLSEPLDGNVYLAAQHDNPFGSDFAIYLGIDDAKTGLVIKLPGRIDADPNTGQLTATFDNNPQLPLEHFRLHFFNGPQASLANPGTCGTKTTLSQLVPWSAADPDNPTAAEISRPSDAFDIEAGPSGGSCAPSAAQQPFDLGFQAGAEGTRAGASNPFSFRITRPDGAQEMDSIDLITAPGVSASLKGIPACTEAAIDAAKTKTGREELASPSCPAASKVGSTLVGSGAGSNPYYSGGDLYLAGPYKGAPLSVVSITPAVAGPFDLGNVVLRTAVFINRQSAQVVAKTDPIPRIIDGVVLRIRDVRVKLDRKDWTINPTNCDASAVSATVHGSAGATANLSSRFQVGGCRDLAFGPRFSARLTGGTKRGDHPAFTASVNFPQGPGYANTKDVQVALPHSEFLDQANIRTVCTRVQAAAHACPPGSIYGYAEAETPLLDGKLTGPVFLKSSDHKLPDLAIALKGPDSQPIEVEFAGRIDSIHGQIRDTIEALPDVPVTSFTLKMKGGSKGLLVNSRNLCIGKRSRMTVHMVGQNNKGSDSRPPLGNACKARHKKNKRHGAH